MDHEAQGRAFRARLAGCAMLVTLAAGLSRGAAQQPSGIPSAADSVRVARTWFDQEQRDDAERLVRRLLPQLETSHGSHSAEVGEALDLLVTMLWRTGRPRASETRELAERALAVKGDVYGTDHLEYAKSLQNLGILQSHANEFAAAESTFMQVRRIREALLPAGHADIVHAITALGVARHSAGDLQGAIGYFRESIAVAEAEGDPVSSDVNLARINLSQVLIKTGQYAEARILLDRLIGLLEPTESLMLANALHQRALLTMHTGDHLGAVAIYRRALDIAERRVGPLASTPVQVRNSLAKDLIYLEHFAEARELIDRQLELLEPDGPSLSLGRAYVQLARLCGDLGDYHEELHWQQRALEIMETIYPPDHPRVAETVFLLGVALGNQERWEEQKEAIERARVILLQRNGPTDPWQSYAYSYLAENALERGDQAEARELLNEALVLQRTHVGMDTPRAAEVLVQLGRLDLDQLRCEEACAHLAQALAIVEARFGADHPRSGEIRLELARGQLAAGRPVEALENALAAHQVLLASTRMTLRVLPHRQALRFAGRLARSLDLLLALAQDDAQARTRERIWDAIITVRALVLDEMATRNRAAAPVAPVVHRRVDAYQEASTRLANLYVRGADEAESEDYANLLEDARRAMEESERLLRASEPATERRFHGLGLAEIRAALGPRDALVAVSRYAQASGASRYHSFILTGPKAEVIALDLGDAGAIDALIADWRAEASQGAMRTDRSAEASRAACDRAGRALRAAAWDPIAAQVAAAERVFLVPDGELQLINWIALPSADGRYLLEEAPAIWVLTTERDLAEPGAPVAESASPFASALVVGAPDFDAPGALMTADAAGTAYPRSAPYRGWLPDCPSLRAVRFAPLEGSLEEALAVARLWRDRAALSGAGGAGSGANSVVLLTGAEASEAAFKTLARGRKLIHLATHGYVLDRECRHAATGHRGIGVIISEPTRESATSDDQDEATGRATSSKPGGNLDPLLAAGFAFAGANQRSSAGPEDEDGILTAQEIAALDLSGTDLAVLSACDTGTGAILNGEGVLGLRRAFAMAGAKTIVTSLWAVRDDATREWMTSFYSAFSRESMGVQEATRKANLAIVMGRRAAGRDDHPFYWAGFVATGR